LLRALKIVFAVNLVIAILLVGGFRRISSRQFPKAREYGTGKFREPADWKVCATQYGLCICESALRKITPRFNALTL
jgi:hypothetical protein